MSTSEKSNQPGSPDASNASLVELTDRVIAETPAAPAPPKLSPAEQEKFYWFTRGTEVGICSAANVAKQDGRKEFHYKLLSLLDSKDFARLSTELFWELNLDWGKAHGDKPASETPESVEASADRDIVLAE